MHPHTTCPACQAVKLAAALAPPVPTFTRVEYDIPGPDATDDELIAFLIQSYRHSSWSDTVQTMRQRWRITRKP